MRPNVILLVALLVVSAGALAAGCTSPGGNVTQPTAPPTGTETPSVTGTTTTGTPAATTTTTTGTPSVTGTTTTGTPSATTTTTTGTPAATTTTAAANVTTAATTATAGGKTATVDLAAENIKFDKSTITVPAGAEVTVNFNNKDSGVPHNFAVYTDSSASQSIFKGDTITGPATTTYTFTAPSKPGTYFFRCDIHPQQMNGDFIVQ